MSCSSYRTFTIISICMAFLFLSSCSQSQKNEIVPNIINEKNYGVGKPLPDHLADFHPSTLELPIQKVKVTYPNKTPREVLGFYTEQEGAYPGSQPTVDTQSPYITIIAPFWYKLDDKKPGSLLNSVTADHKRKIIQSAHQKNIKVYLVVHNLFYGTVEKGKQVASAVLDNDINRSVFIQNLRNELKQFSYDGINIDMENLYMTDKNSFSLFIKNLSHALHADGKAVTVSVPANTGDSHANPWSPWFDYAKLGQYADRLVIMTYDEHNPRTKPGTTASLDWTEATIKYALNHGVRPSKILLGIAGYGWNWDTTANKSIYSSYALLMSQKAKYKTPIFWDSVSQTPYLSYVDENKDAHQAWFENSYSLRFKLDLVEFYNLQGIGIWRLGLEDPMYWKAIPEKIRIKK